ncbi:MAG: PorT family protein [Bacteroidales bacterium]|nr:PorT family protein [Bacteroidales bacterium]
MTITNTLKIKLSIIAIFFSTLLSVNSFAQDSNSVAADNYVPKSEFRTVRLGITGGMGISWMNPKTTGYEKNGSTFSYSYGLLIDYNFTQNYTFSSGVKFNRLGGKLKFANDTNVIGSIKQVGTLERSYYINSLEIPTLLKLKTNQMGYLTYFAQLGLLHNFALSSFGNDKLSANNSVTETNDIDMADYTSFYRISFNVGVGAEYAISQSFSGFAYLEFDNGLNSSLNSEKTNNDGKIISPNENAFIKKFALTFGFMF